MNGCVRSADGNLKPRIHLQRSMTNRTLKTIALHVRIRVGGNVPMRQTTRISLIHGRESSPSRFATDENDGIGFADPISRTRGIHFVASQVLLLRCVHILRKRPKIWVTLRLGVVRSSESKLEPYVHSPRPMSSISPRALTY